MEVIVGAAVSCLVQWLKQYSTNEYVTLGILILLSLVGAGVYTALVVAGYWQSVVGILVTASLFYQFILARFEK